MLSPPELSNSLNRTARVFDDLKAAFDTYCDDASDYFSKRKQIDGLSLSWQKELDCLVSKFVGKEFHFVFRMKGLDKGVILVREVLENKKFGERGECVFDKTGLTALVDEKNDVVRINEAGAYLFMHLLNEAVGKSV